MTWLYITALFMTTQTAAVPYQPDLMAVTSYAGNQIVYAHDYLAGGVFYDLQSGKLVYTSEGVYTVTNYTVYIARDTSTATHANPVLMAETGDSRYYDLLAAADGDLILTTCYSYQGHGVSTGRIIITLDKLEE